VQSEAVMSYFKVLPWHLTDGTERETVKHLSQDSRSVGCDLKIKTLQVSSRFNKDLELQT
jgi:hypothetical protein